MKQPDRDKLQEAMKKCEVHYKEEITDKSKGVNCLRVPHCYPEYGK
jgi:hypothetical protein